MATTSQDRRVNIYINDKNASNTIKGIGAEARKLRNELAKMPMESKEYADSIKKLAGLNKTLTDHRKAIGGVGDSWGRIKEQLIGFGATALAYAGFQQIVGGIDNLISRNADLSDSYADVMKTTGLTREEVEELSQSFKAFNTRTSKKELLELARIAGKQGVEGFKNLRDIVKETDQVIVALGSDLGAGAEDVVGMLLKITEVYGLTDTMDMGEAIRRTGSAVNELGASSNANEGYIVDFTKRLGGVAPLANISAPDILGLAATFDVLGQSQEVAATATTQFLTKIGENVPKFAKLAGMEINAFSALLKENGNAAMIAVLEGAKANEGGLQALAKSMGDMGAEGVRSIGVLGALSQNLDVLKEQQELSNKAFKEGTSLANEFALKNDNLAAKLERVNKWINGMFINGGVLVAFEKLVGLADDFIHIPLSETMEKERMELNSLVSMLIEHNDNQVRRKEIIAEIQSKYPDFLKNMDTELVTTETLTKALEGYNKEMLRKITLQAYEDELMVLAKEKVTLERERYTVEKEANDAAQKAAKILGVELRANMSLLEKYNKLQAASDALGLGVLDQGKIQNAQKYILQIQGLVKLSHPQGWFGMETGLNKFDSQIKDIGDKMQDIVKMRNAFDAANQPEAPASKNGPRPDFAPKIPFTPNAPKGKTPELTEAEKKAIQERIDANKKMLEELALLRISMIEDDFERELAMLEHKKQLDKQGVLDSKASKEVQTQMLLGLDEKYLLDVADLNHKYFDKQKKEREDELKELEKLKKEQYETEYRDLVAVAQMKVLLTAEGTRERFEAEQELILLQANWEITQVKLTEKEKLLLKAETVKRLAEMEADMRRQSTEQEQQAATKRKEQQQQLLTDTVDASMSMIQSLKDVLTLSHDLRMQEIDEERAALEEQGTEQDQYRSDEKDRLKERYEQKMISRQEYDKYEREIDGRYNSDRQSRLEALDNKAKELQRKQAKRQKALSLMYAIIDGARAVTTALANPPGPPFSIPQAVAAGAFSAVQIATIATQKIPQFAKGGMTGYPTFASGGHVSSTKVGMIGEKGAEWVAPNWMLTNPETANVIGMLENMRTSRSFFANGGMTAKERREEGMGPLADVKRQLILGRSFEENQQLMLGVLTDLKEILDKGVDVRATATIDNRSALELDSRISKLRAGQKKGRIE